MLELLYAQSFKGKRKKNEGAFLTKEYENGDWLLAVADGVGSGAMGDVLSKRSMEILDNSFKEAEEFPWDKLYKIVFIVNSDLENLLAGKKGATTLSVVYYSAKLQRVYYINIGDSRVWLCRDDSVVDISIDQNRYEERKFSNLIAEQEDKRFLIASLGGSSDIRLMNILNSNKWQAMGYRDLLKGDTLMLTTDGFHDYMDADICKKIRDSWEELLGSIEELSKDNITVIKAKESA
jgi:serine/threonine protein phosphatase PrpC